MEETQQLYDSNEKNWNQMLPNANLALLPTVLAGIGGNGQMYCRGYCSIGRASQLFSFHVFFLRNIFWPNYDIITKKKKPAGYITFSLPMGSSHLNTVSMFKNIIPIAKIVFGEDKVKVVDMAKLTIQEEVLLVMDSAVLFVNNVGGSSTSIFLQRDTCVFLYLHGVFSKGLKEDNDKNIGCDRGRGKVHYYGVFYKLSGYLRPTWIEEVKRTNIIRIKNLLGVEYKKTMDSWSKRTST